MFPLLGWPWLATGGAAQPRTQPRLEVLRREPAPPPRETPVVFVHGGYLAAWCWEEHFLDHFAARSFRCLAPSLRGHGGSEGRESLHEASLDDYVQDLASVTATLERPPVLVGHSMGGVVVQRYLAQHPAAAVVFLAGVPPGGLLGSTLRLTLGDPLLMGQLMLMQLCGPDAVDLKIARRALFSPDVPDAVLQRLAQRAQQESQRAIWEMTTSAPVGRLQAPNVLVVGAEKDALFTTSEARATARWFGGEVHIEQGLAHAMMLEPGWERVADRIVTWLDERRIP